MWAGCIPVFILGLVHQASAQVCNGVQEFTPNGETGSLTVNANYGNNMACYWKITAATNKIVRLTINTVSLSVEPYCGADIVRVYDSSGELLMDLCGVWRSPPTLVSSRNSMSVLFISDGTSSSGQGFRATWTADTFSRVNCPRSASLTGRSGVLESSPLSGLYYSNSASCRWRINTWPAVQTITLTFEELDLEPQWECNADRVEVFDQNDRLIATRCNNRDKSPVIAPGSTISVSFTTDGKGVGRGFRITYQAGDVSTTTPTTTTPTTTTSRLGPTENICNNNLYKRLSSNTGSLGTPLGGYNQNQYCVWDLLVAYPMVVVLELKRFDVQTSADCSGDHLEFRDIRNTRLRKICGKLGEGSPLPKITSGSYWMRMIFRSDNSGSAPGFAATYEAQAANMASCSGIKTLTGSTGVITNSPNGVDYTNEANCRWRITVQRNMNIELTFTRFDLEESVVCLKDSVKIYDGFSAQDRLMQTICYSNRNSPLTFTSSGNSMYIVFGSDSSIVGSGFSGTYESVTVIVDNITTTTTAPRPTCGLRDLGRILNGQGARPHSWPWMASLRLNNGRRHLCGGSLIDAQWVVTAAHCVSHLTSATWSIYSVLLGAHDLTNSGVSHSISRVIIHPNYVSQVDPADQRRFYLYDIALIRLTQPATLSGAVRPICLPTGDLPLNTDCKVTGWGELMISEGRSRIYSDILLETRAPLAHPFYCSSHSIHGYKYRSDTMLCAGFLDGFSGACMGDNGGPLACGDASQIYYLQGVFTFNTDCKSYGVFTRVTRFLTWIRNTMNSP